MRPVNLIPPEDRRGDHAPLRAGVASYAIVGALALALIGVVLVVTTSNQISDRKAELATLEVRKAQADLTAHDLAPFTNFASLSQARTLTVSSLAQSRFDWERVLKELALVIPPYVTLENLTGTVSAGASVSAASTSSAAAPDASIAGPSLVIQGCAQGQEGTAAFLAALKDIDGVTRVGMQSSELPGEDTATATGDSAAAGTSDSCQTRPSIAHFQITVAFDAVPVPETAAAPAGTPAAAPATGATTTPTTTTAAPTTTSTTPTAGTDASGTAETASQQQSAVDSANQQVSDSKKEAATVGVGGG